MRTFFIFLLSLFISIPLLAQWTGVMNPNVVVSSKPTHNMFPISVSSGDGGSIVVFVNFLEDEYGNRTPSVAAQKINANGTLAWGGQDNPVIVDDHVEDTYTWDYERKTMAVEDGAGGVFIAWADAPSTGTVWIQHLNASGEANWASGGLLVSNLSGEIYVPRLCLVRDDEGGVFISWNTRSATIGPRKMYVRRYNTSGNVLWTKQPTVSATSKTGEIVMDGAGGVIAFFNDSRNDGIFAQRIDPDGNYKWADDGVNVCTAASRHYLSTVDGPNGLGWREQINHAVADGSGGAIVMFNDNRNSSIETVFGQAQETNIDVYAQHIDANGNLMWNSEGIAVALRKSKTNDECFKVLSDGSGGAVVKTENIATTTVRSLALLQRISSNGERAWGDSGIVLTKGWDVFYSSIRSDEEGNTYAASIFPLLNEYDNLRMEVRKINLSGIDLWPEGVLLSTGPFYDYQVGVTPVEGGAILSFTQVSSYVNIYANRILANGTLAKKVFITLAAGNWDDPSVWQDGLVPPAGADIIIMHNVVVNVDVQCHSLLVKNGAFVKVNPGVKLDIMEP